MTNITKKVCKRCTGTGVALINSHNIEPVQITCPDCDGFGVPLSTTVEDQYEEYAQAVGDYVDKDDERYIDFEEEDYEI